LLQVDCQVDLVQIYSQNVVCLSLLKVLTPFCQPNRDLFLTPKLALQLFFIISCQTDDKL